MIEREFSIEVTQSDALQFAELSGDWNPLHTDLEYAAKTPYKRPILHGAFSSGLFSRMAGMYLPGENCLLHDMKLKFIAPIFLPSRLRVHGTLIQDHADEGVVRVLIQDVDSGIRYVEGSYSFRQRNPRRMEEYAGEAAKEREVSFNSDGKVVVTGVSGGLGSAVLSRLGRKAIGISQSGHVDAITVSDLDQLPDILAGHKISGIIHCGWPRPDNQRLISLGSDTAQAVSYHVSNTLRDCIKLAQLLTHCGQPNSVLVLVGSTSAKPGRHGWRNPLYSLGKSLVPTLVEILAVELGARSMRCVGLVFDVIEGSGVNANMRKAVELAHVDRSPGGSLATPPEAAAQIEWILENSSKLVSGSVITLSGGALP